LSQGKTLGSYVPLATIDVALRFPVHNIHGRRLGGVPTLRAHRRCQYEIHYDTSYRKDGVPCYRNFHAHRQPISLNRQATIKMEFHFSYGNVVVARPASDLAEFDRTCRTLQIQRRPPVLVLGVRPRFTREGKWFWSWWSQEGGTVGFVSSAAPLGLFLGCRSRDS
jgi:hypothetical protein